MQSGDSTPRAVGLPRRSEASCSVTNGGPSNLFFSRYRRELGDLRRRRPGQRTVGRSRGRAACSPRRRRRAARSTPWGWPRHRVEAFLCLSWTAFCTTPAGVLHCGRARRRRRLWPGGLGPGRPVEQGGPLGGRPGQVAAGIPAPQGLGRSPHRGLGVRPRRPREGGGERGRGPGRRDQRGQHQHPDRSYRPGDLQDPPRGGPHLRPPPRRDLPAPRDSHRGHRDVDHRPGPTAPAPRGDERRLVRRQRPSLAARPFAPRELGRPGRCAISRSPATSR